MPPDTTTATAPPTTPAAAPPPAAKRKSPAPAGAETPAPVLIPGRVESVDGRAADLIASIRQEQREEADAEPDEGDPAAAAPKPTAADGDKPRGEPAKVEAPADKERRERVERAAALERQNLAQSTKLQEREARAVAREQAAEARERKLADFERRMAEREKVFSDPASLLELLAEKVPAHQLADWMVQSRDPAKMAAWEAKRAAREAAEKASPETEALKRQVAEMQAQLHHAHATQVRAAKVNEFASVVQERSADAPAVAAMMGANPHRLVAMADAAADHLKSAGEDVTFERIVSFLEEDLQSFAPLFAAQSSAGVTPSSQPVSAAAPVARARTLTSRTTAGRSTLLDDESSALSLDERAEQLKRIARRS